MQRTEHRERAGCSSQKAGDAGRPIAGAPESRAEALQRFGLIAYRRGDYQTACDCLTKAVGSDPGRPDCLNHLGVVLSAAGRHDRAVAVLQRAAAASPASAAVHINLGLALQRGGRHLEALDCFRQAIFLAPEEADPYFNSGNALAELGRWAEAESHFRHALRLRPDFGKAHNNLGNTLRALGRVPEAVASFSRALAAMPESIGAMNNLGNALRASGSLAQAERYFRQALALRPESADTWCNLGNALRDDRRHDEALACYARALDLNPGFAEVHFNRAWILLLKEKFDEGWQEYEWRLRQPAWVAGAHGRVALPEWRGEPFPDRRLLVYDEQGFGDAIQFARYLPLVKALGGSVIFETRPELLPLFKTLQGADRLVARRSIARPAVEADAYVALLSLPRLFGTGTRTVPWTGPYLKADPSRRERWGARLGGPAFRIGIAWSGSQVDPLRACPPESFAFLERFPDIRLYSLQKEVAPADREKAPAGIFPLGGEFNDFADTAAVIDHLDLVVSVDTAVAHLSGAMGKPTWLLLPYTADWRWLENREDTPWYPTMRLFRQKTWGDWQEVFERVATGLRAHLGSHPAAEVGA
jgi:tetratricopeptide (TPR) repeat protein